MNVMIVNGEPKVEDQFGSRSGMILQSTFSQDGMVQAAIAITVTM